uniref:FtsH n=1 Tax=Pterocladiophila hemisphaerica TaxID=2712948 RepID=A0A6M3WWG7_9FLOR|nr:ftsH [Pterocladiophila hemisphaerica]
MKILRTYAPFLLTIQCIYFLKTKQYNKFIILFKNLSHHKIRYSSFIHLLKKKDMIAVNILIQKKNIFLYFRQKSTRNKWYTQISQISIQTIKTLLKTQIHFNCQSKITDSNLISSNLYFLILIFIFLLKSNKEKIAFKSQLYLNKNINIKQRQLNIKTFKHISRLTPIIKECKQVIQLLDENNVTKKIQIKTPKGILFIGPSGTGKTLLAQAIAQASNFNFLIISAAELNDIFIGSGAAKIRKIFQIAQDKKPALIFIDEIDAIGKQRSIHKIQTNTEKENTLNQLLIELDGFKQKEQILVIASTNRVNVLDKALLRPGRFNKHIYIKIPSLISRLKIIKLHAKSKQTEKDISFYDIAKKTKHWSGADLKNLLNESAILAARKRKTVIQKEDIDIALKRMTIGIKRTILIPYSTKKILAIHEIGYALTAYFKQNNLIIKKITIQPEGKYLSQTLFEQNDPTFISKKDFLSKITCLLGGIAASKICLNQNQITTYKSKNLKISTTLIKKMIERMGMSQLGPLFSIGQYQKINKKSFSYSEKMNTEKEQLINFIFINCYKQAYQIILKHIIIFKILINVLTNQQQIKKGQFQQIINKYRVII